MLIDSLSFFRTHWICWKVLGVEFLETKWIKLYVAYSLVVNLMVTVGNPLHLGLSIFQNDNLIDDIKNLTIFATCLACSFKTIIYAINLKKVKHMEYLLSLLDSRVSGDAEKDVYSQLKTQQRNIQWVFICIFMPIGVFAELSFLFQTERGLIYPAWFPFDWLHSKRNNFIANTYQVVGLCVQLVQNYANDCFPAMMLCQTSAHIKMLHKRFEKIGQNNPKDDEANNELEACITDHKNLLELFQTMESFMSLPMLIQFAVTGLNVCSSIAALLFFVTDPMPRVYFLFYAVGIVLQIFPTCYYGTDNELWFGQLHYAAFSCNWTSQNRSFKRKLMLFVERSLKDSTAMAGGMMRIHVATFFSTLKFAYSLFTIIIRMQN